MTARLCDVVIATRNRPGPLERCLRSVASQSAPDIGIIVVDDHGDEPLDALIARLTEAEDFDVPPVLVRLPEPSGPAAARNVGVAESSAEFVVFIDDDVVLDRHLVAVHLAEVMAGRGSSSPVVSRGPFVEPPDWSPTPWNLWEARMATRGTAALVRGDYEPTWRQFHTGNNCMPTELFRAVGGFDETFKRAEDDELGLRLHEAGCRFRFVPSALAWHYPHRSLESWLAIPRAYAHYTVVIDRRYPHVGYLDDRKRELARSHALLRAARSVCRGSRRTQAVVSSAVAVARVAHQLGLEEATMGALSLAYDLNFVDALRAAEAAQPDG